MSDQGPDRLRDSWGGRAVVAIAFGSLGLAVWSAVRGALAFQYAITAVFFLGVIIFSVVSQRRG